MKMRLAFLCLFCNILLPIFYAGTKANADEGPYKASLVRAERCKNPPKPFEKNPGAFFYSELYTSGKKTLFRGNLTLVKINPKMRVALRAFHLEAGKWKAVYVANSVGCNGALLRVFNIALNLQTRRGECLPKGTYIFKDVDINVVMQMWSKSYSYGSFLWKVTTGTRTATTICWEFETLNEPIVTK